jgi:hypothetical protein
MSVTCHVALNECLSRVYPSDHELLCSVFLLVGSMPQVSAGCGCRLRKVSREIWCRRENDQRGKASTASSVKGQMTPCFLYHSWNHLFSLGNLQSIIHSKELFANNCSNMFTRAFCFADHGQEVCSKLALYNGRLTWVWGDSQFQKFLRLLQWLSEHLIAVLICAPSIISLILDSGCLRKAFSVVHVLWWQLRHPAVQILINASCQLAKSCRPTASLVCCYSNPW